MSDIFCVNICNIIGICEKKWPIKTKRKPLLTIVCNKFSVELYTVMYYAYYTIWAEFFIIVKWLTKAFLMIFKMPVVKIQENTKFIYSSRFLFTLTLSVARLKMLYEEQKWMWIKPETFFLRLNTVLVTRIKMI